MRTQIERMTDAADYFNSLPFDPEARIGYDLFAGGLVWSDETVVELAVKKLVDISCLRGVWYYRSTLILGQPTEKGRAQWEAGLKLFPNWPGFHPSRRDPKWRDEFLRIKEAGDRSWDELDERYRRQQAAAMKGSVAVPALPAVPEPRS